MGFPRVLLTIPSLGSLTFETKLSTDGQGEMTISTLLTGSLHLGVREFAFPDARRALILVMGLAGLLKSTLVGNRNEGSAVRCPRE